MTFDRAYEKTASFEGGWSDHPNDAGGRTSFGITQHLAARYNYRVEDVTPEIAKAIMRGEFWERTKVEKIPTSLIAHYMFDWCVNSGPNAVKKMQRVLGVMDDGVIGPVTIAKIKHEDQFLLLRKLMVRRMKNAIAYCEHDERQYVFVRGWAQRFFAEVWTRP